MASSGPRILHTHRQTVHIVERARVYVEDNRVLYQMADNGSLKSFNVPFANISVLFLGKTRAGGLVFDLADSFKDALVLPLAFSDFSSDQEFRANLISAIQDQEIMKSCFETMSTILSLGDDEATL